MKGNLKTEVLANSTTPTGTFQLPKTHVSTAHVAPMPKEGGFHRRGFTGKQMGIMMKAFNERIGGMGEMYAAIDGVDGMFESLLEAIPTEPEWVFHGTTTPWDTVYDSGGLQRVGDNVNVHEHVKSSMTHGSGYIATSRVLSVAVSFAKSTDGWIYLIYSTCGMKASSTIHNQDEIIIPGDVPIRDIYMIRHLKDANVVYVNNDFRGPLLSTTLETRCLRLIGGL